MTLRESHSSPIAQVNRRSGPPTRRARTRSSSPRSAPTRAIRAGLRIAVSSRFRPTPNTISWATCTSSPPKAASRGTSRNIPRTMRLPASPATASGSTSAPSEAESHSSGRFRCRGDCGAGLDETGPSGDRVVRRRARLPRRSQEHRSARPTLAAAGQWRRTGQARGRRRLYQLRRDRQRIYYIEQVPGEARLRYFDFATHQSRVIAANIGTVATGVAASRDGRTIYFSRVDSSVNDLMLVENFR